MPKKPYKIRKVESIPPDHANYYIVERRDNGKPLGLVHDMRQFNLYDNIGHHWEIHHPIEKVDGASLNGMRRERLKDAAAFLFRKDKEYFDPELPMDEQPPGVQYYWEERGGRPDVPEWEEGKEERDIPEDAPPEVDYLEWQTSPPDFPLPVEVRFPDGTVREGEVKDPGGLNYMKFYDGERLSLSSEKLYGCEWRLRPAHEEDRIS